MVPDHDKQIPENGTALDITARRETEDRRALLAALSEALRDLQEPGAIVFAAAELLGRALGVSRVGYAAIDDQTETLHVERDWTAAGVETLAGVLSLRAYGSFVDSLKHDEFVVIVNVREDARTAGAADTLEAKNTRSFVGAPVVEQGHLVAVFFVADDKVRIWSAGDLALIKEFAGRTRTAVERARSENALGASELRYRTLFESIDAGVCVFDMIFDETGKPVDYVFVEVNPAFIVQTGLVDAVGKRISDLAPNPEQRWYDLYGEVALTGTPLRIEDYAKALGKTFEIYAYKVGKTDQRRVVALFNDVSKRKRSEALIHELNETLERQVIERTAELRRFRDIVEATTSPICAFDTEFRLIAFNKAHNDEFRRVNGFDTKLGDVFPDLFIPEQGRAMRRLMTRALSGESFTVTEEFGRPELGQPLWEISYTPLRDESGAIIGAFHLADDISDRIRAEADLASAQEALRQSQKMEAVGQLTGGLAHDFNNLLAGISGSLEMMQTRIQQGRIPELEKYMVGAQGAARRAAALTHRLLAFSRRQTLEPKPTDVNRLVVDMEDLIRRTVGPQITVETVAKGGLWSTLVDPNQLENALLNLCLNARDAMPDGGRIMIETGNRWLDDRAAKERDLPPGQYVSMCVSDNGTGMPKAIVERAFDPFFTTKPIGLGTGLGLSMIYGFARQSGGQVRIYSEVGQGTMVCIYLPRHGEEEAAEAAPLGEPEVARAPDGRTVLVIDDEPLVRMLVVDILQDIGYTTIEAGDGPQAMKIIRSGARVDLLITDVGLPNGMNGRQIADAAREIRPELKVLFVTGYAENAVLSHGHLDPGMQVVTKPFEMNVLAKKIQDLLVE